MILTRDEKLKLAREHFDKGMTIFDLSSKYNLGSSSVKYIIAMYKIHGEKPFLIGNERKVYTREFKLSIIKEYFDTGLSYRKLGLKYQFLEPSMIDGWIKKYKELGEEGITTTRSRPTYLHHEDRIDKIVTKELKQRIEYLEAENAYLKKSYSLILERNKLRKKKQK